MSSGDHHDSWEASQDSEPDSDSPQSTLSVELDSALELPDFQANDAYGAVSVAESTYSAAYTGLPGNSIRLLKVLPRTAGHEIHCELFVYKFEDIPPYDAVSYVWGAAPAAHDIVLSGHRFTVRKNLWRFLAQAQKSASIRSKYLWIDAICINQADNAERTLQVGLMAQIYSQAASVIVWLGPSYCDSDRAISTLRKGQQYWASKNNIARLWAKPVAANLVSLCMRPYWKRLWVFQELALAKRAVVVCGSQTLPYESLEVFLALARDTMPLSRSIERGEYEMFKSSPALAMAQGKQSLTSRSHLWDLIFATKHLRCSETRDKVYALLGVANGGDTSIDADYGLPIPALLNVVLRKHHETHCPRTLDEVEQQTRDISTLFGDTAGILFLGSDTADLESVERAVFGPKSGLSPLTLRWACHHGHLPVQRLLIGSGRVDTETSLYRAVKARSLETIQMILKVDDFQVNTEINGRTALTLAIESQQHALVEALVTNPRINVNLADERGFAPIVIAANAKDSTCISLLMQTGRVDFERRDIEGHTPIEWAVVKNNMLAFMEFSAAYRGADPTSLSIPLREAIYHHRNEMANVLLQLHDEDQQWQRAQEPLAIEACLKSSNQSALKLILDPRRRRNIEESDLPHWLLDVARKIADPSCAKLLACSGRCAPIASDLDSSSRPLLEAIEGRKNDMVEVHLLLRGPGGLMEESQVLKAIETCVDFKNPGALELVLKFCGRSIVQYIPQQRLVTALELQDLSCAKILLQSGQLDPRAGRELYRVLTPLQRAVYSRTVLPVQTVHDIVTSSPEDLVAFAADYDLAFLLAHALGKNEMLQVLHEAWVTQPARGVSSRWLAAAPRKPIQQEMPVHLPQDNNDLGSESSGFTRTVPIEIPGVRGQRRGPTGPDEYLPWKNFLG